MEEGKSSLTSVEKDWSLLKKDVKKFINLIEDGDVVIDNSSFTIQDYMSIYTSIYELWRVGNDIDCQLLLDKYKKLFTKYINSKVLPSLRAKNNEVLLRELLKRWSSHKIITCWLSRLFGSLETFGTTKISLKEIGFLSFYDLVYEEVNNKVMDAILAMIDEDCAGKQIDRKLVNNILALYLEINDKTGKNDAKYFAEKIIKENATLISCDDEVSNWMAAISLIDNTPKEEKLKSSKKLKVMSYDGDVFEVDYDVALMSKTLQDVIESYPNIEESIPLYNKSCSSKILGKIIEYCKKRKDEEESHMMEDWDAEFIDLDHTTLVNRISSSAYLNIDSLGDLACVKIIHMNKGKTIHELCHIFGC